MRMRFEMFALEGKLIKTKTARLGKRRGENLCGKMKLYKSDLIGLLKNIK